MTQQVVIPFEWWTLLVGTVLPAIVALVRQRYSASKWGAILLLALTAVTAVVAEIPDGTFEWGDVGKRFVMLFVAAVVAHFGFLRGLGVTGHDGVIARTVPGGIGTALPLEPAVVPAEGHTVFSSDQKSDATYYDPYPGAGPGGGG